MDGKRTLPTITDEMACGSMRCRVVVREINLSIIGGVVLGHNCALPSCHSIVRLAGMFIENFDVVDGFIPVMKSRIENGKVTNFNVMPMYHSWLALKSDPKFILDVIPIGSVPPFISHTFLYLDMYATDYIVSGLSPDVSQEEINQDTEKMFELLGVSLTEQINKLPSAT